MLGDLPAGMRTDIALYLHREVLEKVPFFQNASDAFISVLVRYLKPQVMAPGTYMYYTMNTYSCIVCVCIVCIVSVFMQVSILYVMVR